MAGEPKWIFSKEELQNTPSQKAGIDAEKELNYRQQCANLIQDMGQKLQVTQLCINTAIVFMHRFYMFHSFSKFHRNPMGAACLFLAAKVEEQPRKLEHVIRAYHFCVNRDQASLDVKSEAYLELAQECVINENILLQTLGFSISVEHPHAMVVKTCTLVKASKDLAQTSYFLATNSLHLTTMCLKYSHTVVACVCIHLACKWSNYQIPRSTEGKEWYEYVDKKITKEMLDDLTQEFLQILDNCPSKLKKKILTWKSGARSVDDQAYPGGDPNKRGDHNEMTHSPQHAIRHPIPSVSGAGKEGPPALNRQDSAFLRRVRTEPAIANKDYQKQRDRSKPPGQPPPPSHKPGYPGGPTHPPPGGRPTHPPPSRRPPTASATAPAPHHGSASQHRVAGSAEGSQHKPHQHHVAAPSGPLHPDQRSNIFDQMQQERTQHGPGSEGQGHVQGHVGSTHAPPGQRTVVPERLPAGASDTVPSHTPPPSQPYPTDKPSSRPSSHSRHHDPHHRNPPSRDPVTMATKPTESADSRPVLEKIQCDLAATHGSVQRPLPIVGVGKPVPPQHNHHSASSQAPQSSQQHTHDPQTQAPPSVQPQTQREPHSVGKHAPVPLPGTEQPVLVAGQKRPHSPSTNKHHHAVATPSAASVAQIAPVSGSKPEAALGHLMHSPPPVGRHPKSESEGGAGSAVASGSSGSESLTPKKDESAKERVRAVKELKEKMNAEDRTRLRLLSEELGDGKLRDPPLVMLDNVFSSPEGTNGNTNQPSAQPGALTSPGSRVGSGLSSTDWHSPAAKQRRASGGDRSGGVGAPKPSETGTHHHHHQAHHKSSKMAAGQKRDVTTGSSGGSDSQRRPGSHGSRSSKDAKHKAGSSSSSRELHSSGSGGAKPQHQTHSTHSSKGATHSAAHVVKPEPNEQAQSSTSPRGGGPNSGDAGKSDLTEILSTIGRKDETSTPSLTDPTKAVNSRKEDFLRIGPPRDVKKDSSTSEAEISQGGEVGAMTGEDSRDGSGGASVGRSKSTISLDNYRKRRPLTPSNENKASPVPPGAEKMDQSRTAISNLVSPQKPIDGSSILPPGIVPLDTGKPPASDAKQNAALIALKSVTLSSDHVSNNNGKSASKTIKSDLDNTDSILSSSSNISPLAEFTLGSPAKSLTPEEKKNLASDARTLMRSQIDRLDKLTARIEKPQERNRDKQTAQQHSGEGIPPPRSHSHHDNKSQKPSTPSPAPPALAPNSTQNQAGSARSQPTTAAANSSSLQQSQTGSSNSAHAHTAATASSSTVSADGSSKQSGTGTPMGGSGERHLGATAAVTKKPEVDSESRLSASVEPGEIVDDTTAESTPKPLGLRIKLGGELMMSTSMSPHSDGLSPLTHKEKHKKHKHKHKHKSDRDRDREHRHKDRSSLGESGSSTELKVKLNLKHLAPPGGEGSSSLSPSGGAPIASGGGSESLGGSTGAEGALQGGGSNTTSNTAVAASAPMKLVLSKDKSGKYSSGHKQHGDQHPSSGSSSRKRAYSPSVVSGGGVESSDGVHGGSLVGQQPLAKVARNEASHSPHTSSAAGTPGGSKPASPHGDAAAVMARASSAANLERILHGQRRLMDKLKDSQGSSRKSSGSKHRSRSPSRLPASYQNPNPDV